MSNRKYKSFKAFYPFYLSEHRNPVCRNLHLMGTGLFFFILLYAIFQNELYLLWILPVVGYGFAWVGHFFFEKNKPATFQYPLWSLASDFKMFFQWLAGNLKKNLSES